jgi:hypothetical protein
MKKSAFALLSILIALAVVFGWKYVFKKKTRDDVPEPAAMTVSRHSDAFNQSVNKMLDAYYRLTEAFVNWDTAAVNKSADELRILVDSLKLDEMKKDSAIYPTVESYWNTVKTEVAGLRADEEIYEKRESLNFLSQQLFDLLRTIKYDAANVYYQECPMALNNYESSAFWLSTSGEDDDRRNPYLGLHDPKYGKAMLICGATRDSLHFAE